MNQKRRMTTVWLAVAMALATILPSIVKAADTPPGLQVDSFMISAGIPEPTVRDAVYKAALQRLWVVASQQEGEVVLRMVHRGMEANLTVQIVGSEIRIYSDSYAIDKNGLRKSAAKVNEGWIKNLRKGIQAQLANSGASVK